jgi:hypothetical protein
VYRDDPLDDEAELRDLLGEAPVDALVAADNQLVAVAADIASVLLGWGQATEVAGWFLRPQQRLDGRSPLDALLDQDVDEVEEAARLWAAARG